MGALGAYLFNEEDVMGAMLDKVMPFAVGHRTELTVLGTAVLNLLNAVPGAAKYVGPVTGLANSAAPFLAALFAAARASRTPK